MTIILYIYIYIPSDYYHECMDINYSSDDDVMDGDRKSLGGRIDMYVLLNDRIGNANSINY
jgi:hypothetical protein